MPKNNKIPISYEPNDEDTVQSLFFAPMLHANQWDSLSKELNNSIKTLSQDYLWHKDAFKVFLPIIGKNEEYVPPHLKSSTTFGDNIEDEWFIVHIILELTKYNKDLIVQIQDNDGDFLLIEAANYLPEWAKPETTENRVFIHNNHIHLIPPNVASLDEQLTLNEAIQLIIDNTNKTQVSVQIEQAILDRIGKYPEKIHDNIHNAIVTVPLEIAALLKVKPNLIAPIVDAYCHHDVIDAKTFRNVSYSDNWATVSVTFTKCLYAMLLYSKLAGSIKQPNNKDKKTILGLKLSCGFHLIMKRSSNIFSSKEYMKFFNSLKENGYFDNNIEGSKEYEKKLITAQEFFSAVECPIASNVCHDITEIQTTEDFLNMKELLQTENVMFNETDDNDDWLTLHPEQLNELLNSRYGKKTRFKKGDDLTPQKITTELENFLKHTADFEGIETNNSDNQENNVIDFEADQFENCIEKMLKLLSSNNDEVESIDSDFSEENMSMSEEENEIDKELKEKLHGAKENSNDNITVLKNIVQSMKEEKASIGPSSNLISNLGLRKTDFQDSDDEE